MQVISEQDVENLQGKTLTFSAAVERFYNVVAKYKTVESTEYLPLRLLETHDFHLFRDRHPGALLIVNDELIVINHGKNHISLGYHFFDELNAKKTFDHIVIDYVEECQTFLLVFVKLETKQLMITMYDRSGMVSNGFKTLE